MERLPSYQELKTCLPLSASQEAHVSQWRQTVRAILNGQDARLLLIVGPCSIHDIISAKEYATQLKQLSTDVSDHFFVLMRVYCEKPRTAAGWKGFLYDPYLDGSHDMQTGIRWTRQLMQELTDLQVPIATEFLDPLTAFYFDDLVSWGSIGARTSSSQTHRQLASGLTIPIGFKNGIAGNVSAAINGVVSASSPHTYMGMDIDGNPCIQKTIGNLDSHIVLRGGENGPNYDPASVAEALHRMEKAHLDARLLIDCSHQNSGKKYDKQVQVFHSVLHQIIEGNNAIRGLMLESHLYAGNQSLLAGPTHLSYGVSITDGCLDWESTAALIQWGCGQLRQNQSLCEALRA